MRTILFLIALGAILMGKAQSSEGTVVIPDGQTVVGDSSYYKNIEMTALEIPASVEALGNNIVDHCFKLTHLIVHADNPYFKSIDGVIYTKDGKTLVLCPPGKTGEFVVPAHATFIAPYAFRTCKKITAIVLPEGI